MKVYTDYGKSSFKALESCLIEIENTSEWTYVEMALRKDIEQREKHIQECKKIGYDTSELEKHLNKVKDLVEKLEPQNTIPMSEFDRNKITTGLWKKG